MKVDVHTSSKDYPVYIGIDALTHLKGLIQANKYTKLLVITDEIVGPLHLHTLKSSIPESVETVYYTVPSGEFAKQFSVYESCLSYALEQGLDRKSCIIAFGGGAVGDLAGFAAATYMRGIPFIQVPTTILAHDSAVGGKTAINHPLGKNMIGAFHQPDAVVYQTSFLHTLPPSEVRSGFAEAIKHALIADPAFLHFLMENITDLHNLQEEQLTFILKKGIEIKAAIVSKDEKENGLRAVLNFGHTLGHAVESAFGYGRFTHGEAVMIGMVYALYVSKNVMNLDFPIEEFEEWVFRLGYNISIPIELEFETALKGMLRDKKTFANTPHFVLLQEVGKPVVQEMDVRLLENEFHQYNEKHNVK